MFFVVKYKLLAFCNIYSGISSQVLLIISCTDATVAFLMNCLRIFLHSGLPGKTFVIFKFDVVKARGGGGPDLF